jgi:chaperonin GroES
MNKEKKKLIVLGDRVLITPDEGDERTAVGLYLPKTVMDKESVQSGRVVATGPGLPLPEPSNLDDEPWKMQQKEIRFLPMQTQAWDVAIFLRKAAVEIKYDNKTYLVVPQAAILALLRDEDIPIDIE